MGCKPSKRTAINVVVPSPVSNYDRNEISKQRKNDFIRKKRPEVDLAVYGYNAFIEFPTPHLLRYANQQAASRRKKLPVDDNGQLLPYPPATSKESVFDPKKYEHVDKFALQINKSHYNQSLQAFTNQITAPYKKNKIAIARVIFRWLAAQNMDDFANTQTSSSDSVLWHLHRTHQYNGHYTELFLEMCRYAGIQGQHIEGHCKHAHHEIGDEIDTDSSNNWAAIVINKEWRFVDAHWGSSHMVNVKDNWVLIDDNGKTAPQKADNGPEGTAYGYNEKYFLTDPEELIYSHIPKENENWQLLARPVTSQEFRDMAFLKRGFFELDLRLLEQRKCVLYASQGEIVIKIGLPPDQLRNFMYTLWISDKQQVQGTSLTQFCIMQQKNNILFSRIFFPCAGKFKFELYGRALNLNDTSTTHHFQICCAFVIHSDQAAVDAKALPKNHAYEWGPGSKLDALGMNAVSHKDAIIEAIAGVAEVRFKAKRPLEVINKLHSNNLTEDQMQGYAVHYMNKDEIVMNVKVPEAGDYALNIYAKEEGKEGTLPPICSYIVSSAEAAADPRPYPADGRIGPAMKNKPLNLKLVSHDSPNIKCPDTGILELIFDAPVPCDVTSNLKLHKDGDEVDETGFMLKEQGERKIAFFINIPEPGQYVFELFAKVRGQEGTFPLVYSIIIDAPVPKEACIPFPDTYTIWGIGCKLIEPITQVLSAQTKVMFQVIVPNASDLAVIHGGQWTHLINKGSDLWAGEVETSNTSDELSLNAKFDPESNSYSALLKYKVEKKEQLQKEEEKQQKIQALAIRDNQLRMDKERKEAENRRKEFEMAKEGLLQAIANRDLKALYKAVKYLEAKKFVSQLQTEYDAAWKLIKSLERMLQLQKVILDLDKTTMLEMRSYASPPHLVHKVMIAALLLMGDSESRTKEWSECQKSMTTIGKTGLYNRVKTCDVSKLHQEIVARASEIIGNFRHGDVNVQSAGAGAFYAWVAGMINEMHETDSDSSFAKPANSKRQEEIFRKK